MKVHLKKFLFAVILLLALITPLAARLLAQQPQQKRPNIVMLMTDDTGWLLALIYPVVIEFDKSIINFPSIKRFPGGASNDLRPNLQHPDNPVPFLDDSRF